MKKSISVIVTASLLAGCASLPPMKGNPWDRDVNYKIEEGQRREKFTGVSDFTVVIFPEDHNSYGCQANIFLGLEKAVLSGEVRFVAREGRVGPTEHDNQYFQSMKYFDHNLQVGYYKDLIELPFERRRQQAQDWIKNNEYPSWYFRDLNDDPVRNWSVVKPMIATVLNECVYPWVHTVGVESQTALDKADEELGRADRDISRTKDILSPAYVVEEKDKRYFAECQNKADPSLNKEKIFATCRDRLVEIRETDFLKVRNEQIIYRNEGFVENIRKYADTLKFVEGNKVLFPVGAMHVSDLTQRFRDKNISYQVIEYNACRGEDIYE